MAGDYIARLAAQRREETPRHEQQIQCVAHVERHDVGRLHGLDSGALALHGSDAERRDARSSPPRLRICSVHSTPRKLPRALPKVSAVITCTPREAASRLRRSFTPAMSRPSIASVPL